MLRPRLLLPAAALLATAACGTTVPLTSTTGAPSSVDDLGTTGGGTTSGVPVAPSTASASTGTGGMELPGTTPASGPRPGGPAQGPAASGPVPATGRGWDRKNVYIGIVTVSDANTGAKTLGVSFDVGDPLADARAVVDDLNRKGGLLGRRIVLVVRDESTASVLGNPTATGQAVCSHFSQDHPVIAVVNPAPPIDTDTFRGCFAKAKIALVTVNTSAFDDQDAARYAPYLYNALSPSWSKLAGTLVTRLQALRYFTGWDARTGRPNPTAKVRVGVYHGTGSSGRAAARILAGLKRAGYATDSYQYGDPASEGNSAVLRFSSNGVTHVMSTGSLFYFSVAARSQQYRPRFGITSLEAAQALLVRNGDKSQLNGALGVGWYPTLDTEEAQDPGPGPGTRECLAALRAGGQTFSGKRYAQVVALAICDGLRLPLLSAKRAGGLDPVSIRKGVIALGRTFPTGGGFGSGLGPASFALPGLARDLVWDAGVSSFRYQGPAYRID